MRLASRTSRRQARAESDGLAGYPKGKR